jgi:predicted house-cleaning NTP pyrophosphatase (Maf/HAM1 superfamily)
VEQLRNASGKRVDFVTGLCLYNSQTHHKQSSVVPFSVYFRTLNDDQIERYLQHDQPYNCAGSFRSESLGIALFTRMQGDDPNALMGLPLIRLIDMLAAEGISIP